MANSRSAKKRIKTAESRAIRNKSVKTRTKTAVKKLLSVVSGGDRAASGEQLRDTVSVIDKAAAKGVMHKNAAARKKSRLAKKVNKLA